MKKFILALVVLLFPLMVFAGTVIGTVIKIVDGDTVNISQIDTEKVYKVRFLGIDTPELHFYGKSQGYYAEEAKKFLEHNIPVGTKVKIVYEIEKFDRYGRLLGHVYKGWKNINYQLLKEGLAVNYMIYPNLKYLTVYANATKHAIEDHLGIFSEERTELPFEFRMRIRKGEPDKWVGNRKLKKFVDPDQYEEIPVQDRVFFIHKYQAYRYGYKFVDSFESN